MSNWSKRLNEALSLRNRTAADLSRATGVSSAGVKKWVEGRVLQPKFDDVVAICDYLDISANWLMKGVGSMVETGESGSNMIALDQVDIKGSCGYGVINFEEIPEIKKIYVTPAWFAKNFAFYNPSNIRIITAQGDSMSPEIEDGDAVFIDITDKETLRDGIYLLQVDGELFIKRVQKLIKRRIALISTNKAYKDIELDLDSDIEVRTIGRVIKNLKVIDI
ncbi:S24 family peptidase [uncultured Parasutterella sp.]|uniref:S24 family peptidase n=1 Tax=uncultured Parasutterella sp. TaxID=1263098 RepID=UPI0025925A1E|nr:S24 family peptidase [uncultured Parasutterella sp.]